MWKRTALSLCGLLAALTALWVGFALTLRRQSPSVLRAIRRLNRAVVNPRAMETAGQPGAYASAVRHSGRTTGIPYQTPVQALMADDGFVVPLPYGTTADWLRNVLAAGTAAVVHEGDTYRVDRPELISRAMAAPYVPTREQRSHRLYGVDQFLLLHFVAPQEQDVTDEPGTGESELGEPDPGEPGTGN